MAYDMDTMEGQLAAEREAQKKRIVGYNKKREAHGDSMEVDVDDTSSPIYANEQQQAEGVEAKRKQLEGDVKFQQQLQAREFEKGLPALQSNLFQQAAAGERGRLAGEMAGIKRGASSRGLLHSGMRQGAEAKAQAESDVSLAQQQQGINQQLKAQREKLRQAPIKTGLNMVEFENNVANQAMSTAIANMQARNTAMSGFGSALGSALGTYFGKSGSSGSGSSGANAGRYGSNLSQD